LNNIIVRIIMKIVSQVELSNEEIDRLKSVVSGLEVVVATEEDQELEEIADADIFFGRIPQSVFIAGKNLKWVQVFGAGVETQFFPEMVQSDVILASTSGAYNQTMADQAFALILGISRGIAMFERKRLKKQWGRTKSLRQLAGQTLGIIGLGNIGGEIARRGKAFGMKVIAADIKDMECPAFVDQLCRLDNMDEVLKNADYLVIIVPLTDKTRGMIGDAEIKKMKPTAHLINIGRGPLVNEPALINALKTGIIAGAGLDVFMNEPLPPESEFWDMENVVMTPHIGGLSPETRAISFEIFLENFRRFINGEPLRSVIDKQRQF
jgi:phosphoglycerate dehydrogenase-like enzyme